MVRRYRNDDGCLYLGPYRSRRHAEVVMHAIWDAVPLRRCLTRGGNRSAACNYAQLGVAICPCDGSVAEEDYAAVVAQLEHGVITDPETLLAPLTQRMITHARNERFEDAATLRDRHGALGRSLERRRAWQALQGAGMLWAEDGDGDSVLIDHGRLAAAWRAPGSPPLLRITGLDDVLDSVPPSVAVAEEAHLLWRWLDRPGVQIVDATNPLALPATPVPRLETLAG
jgi:DNA polymerase-3 subunit epsilon